MAGSNQDEARLYRVMGVLGEGGFGKVYHARLEGSEGFQKEVAIKLLRDDLHDPSVLQRFRDEARILGLVRDRAVVGVDPPVRLAGRWAVIMDYVDGASAEALLELGPFPPSVALEVVEEVVRALDHVWHQKGPDGQPLHIIHRDLKPSNIQITPSGQVKLLDFGIARGTFARREARTTTHIGGTPGYIAPERLYGDELPAGDIFSLGVVLEQLVTGERRGASGIRDEPDAEGPTLAELQRLVDGPAEDQEIVRRILALARAMRHIEPEERPTAREVEHRCRKLRALCAVPHIREWAEETIPDLPAHLPDDLVGEVLTQSRSTVPRLSDSLASIARGARPVRRGVGILAVVLVLGAGIVLAGVALALAILWGARARPGPVLMPEPIEPAPVAATLAPSPPEPQETAADAEAAAEVHDEPAPVDKGEPEPPAVRVQAAPAADPGGPAPGAEAGPTHEIRVTASPMGAEVFVDGESRGAAPAVLSLPRGAHTLRVVLDGMSAEAAMAVGRHQPTTYHCIPREGTCRAGY